MAYNQNTGKRPTVRRGVTIKLEGVRVETFGEPNVTPSGKKVLSVNLMTPVNLDDASEGEIKFRSNLWEERIDAFKKAGKNAVFGIEGYYKKGKPWKNKDGVTVISNDFVITSMEAAVKSTSTIQEVDEDDNSDSIPF